MGLAELVRLHFGEQQCWELSADGCTIVAPHLPNLAAEQLVEAVCEALCEPIGFPSLDTAVIPGDTVVFALDPSVPQLPEILAAAIQWFSDRGASLSNLSAVVAFPGMAAAERIRKHLEDVGISIEVHAHDADDSEQIAYLAANESSDAIYLNRRLVDADVVIPITCARLDSSLDGLGTFSVFPQLSDRKTRGRFYAFEKLRREEKRTELRKWSEQAGWWLGILASLQVVPGVQGGVQSIRCGVTDQLHDAVQSVMASAWTPPDELADVVVALIDGPQYQQSWLSVARALFSASRLVRPGGSIVVCSELETPAGAGLKKLRQTDKTGEELAKQLSNSDYDDAIAASVLLETTSDCHVFLASALRKDTVESLRMGVVASQDELGRLVRSLDTCIIIESAQYAGCQSSAGLVG